VTRPSSRRPVRRRMAACPCCRGCSGLTLSTSASDCGSQDPSEEPGRPWAGEARGAVAAFRVYTHQNAPPPRAATSP
jgi:hypothetical protein